MYFIGDNITGGKRMEQITDTIIKGLRNLKDNTVLFVPYLVFFMFTFVLTQILEFFSPFFETFITDMSLLLLTDIAIPLIVAVVTIPVFCYVSAGTFGMAKEAIATGMTSLKDMFKYGRQYTVRFFIATILLFIFQLVCVIFWLPLYFAYKNTGYAFDAIFNAFNQLLLENPEPFFSIVSDLALPLFVPFMIGLLLTFVYLIIIWVVFYFISEAIVVDDMPAIAAFKKSFALLKQYPVKVFFFIVLIYLLIVALVSLFVMPIMVFSMLGPAFLIITTLLLSVVSAATDVAAVVWSTRFYMSITEKELYEKENLLDFGN